MSFNWGRHWGVILAGGDGERLRPLTRLIAGDDRPKQFCPLLEGEKTLLEQTQLRVAKAVQPRQTLYVLTQQHERFYANDLAQVAPSRLIVQKLNRGTLPAILSSLARLIQLNGEGFDSQAVVGFFPSDHFYSRERTFMRGVRSAFKAAEAHPDSVILLGADATIPDTNFGYIEPIRAVEGRGNRRLMSVERFWEKPSLEVAHTLVSRGCVWNTFVMVGRLRAFLGLIEETAPELYRAFEPMLYGDSSDESLEAVYETIASADFSKVVLSTAHPRLSVMNLGDVGWSDLGDPQRLIDTLSTHGIRSPWRQLWVREMGIASVAGQ
jgi:mannose-1-phosphate guanylyltransferase